MLFNPHTGGHFALNCSAALALDALVGTSPTSFPDNAPVSALQI